MMLSDKYIVKSKDKPLIEFKIVEKKLLVFEKEMTDIRINIIKVWDENISLFPKSLQLTNGGLSNWIAKRKIPKNRAFVEKILATFEDSSDNQFSYIDVSLALSLNDSYWIIPSNSEYKWKEYNLYDNPFSEALSLVAFTGHSNRIKGLITSPEFTTNGMLKKTWHRNSNEEIVLLKGATQRYANGGLEPYMEFYASQIAAAFGIEHIEYDLQMYHKELVSSCKMFTSENFGYIPVYDLINEDLLKGKTIQNIEVQYEIAKIVGIEFFEDMMLFDSIIYNTDRHLGNFGMLVDNNTGKLVKPAPIFDNGFSLFNRAMEEDISNLEEYSKTLRSAFEMSFDRQAEIYLRKRHIPMIQKLITFKFKKHELYNLPDYWINNIEKHIQKRAKVLITMIDKEKEGITKKIDKIKESKVFQKQKESTKNIDFER